MVLTKLAYFLLSSALATINASSIPVHPDVHRALEAGSADIVIVFKRRTAESLESFEVSGTTSRADKIDAMLNHLEARNADIQKDVFDVLGQESSEDKPIVQRFAVTSNLYVHGATSDFVQKVAQFSNIQEIRAPQVIKLDVPFSSNGESPDDDVQWGIKKIMAAKVWDNGNRGQNVIVASIDTGVRYTHIALKDNFIGSYGWFDPENKSATPYDNNGHGTHTMGTIAGKGGIGVAPGAKWMACKACRTADCPEEDLMACFQFMTCPTDTDGNNRDCTKTPHVINNSWGGGQGDNSYHDAVAAWLKAGIIPVFANGNNGPSCGTANSPGDLDNVIAVGATTSADRIASFSSKGPAKVGGAIKPELSAPGHQVYSSSNSSDDAYETLSGTSMAAPHVTGSIALLLSAKPNTTFAGVKAVLLSAVDTASLQGDNKNCGGIVDTTFPNHAFGHGRLNIYKTIYDNTTPVPTPTETQTPTPTETQIPTPTETQTPTPTPTPTPTNTMTPTPTSSHPDPSDDPCRVYSNLTCFLQDGCSWNTEKQVCES